MIILYRNAVRDSFAQKRGAGPAGFPPPVRWRRVSRGGGSASPASLCLPSPDGQRQLPGLILPPRPSAGVSPRTPVGQPRGGSEHSVSRDRCSGLHRGSRPPPPRESPGRARPFLATASPHTALPPPAARARCPRRDKLRSPPRFCPLWVQRSAAGGASVRPGAGPALASPPRGRGGGSKPPLPETRERRRHRQHHGQRRAGGGAEAPGAAASPR